MKRLKGAITSLPAYQGVISPVTAFQGEIIRPTNHSEEISGSWLCNGLRTPVFPEYDQTIYRYAVMIGDSGGDFGIYTTRLIVSTTPLKYVNNVTKWNLLYGMDSGSCIGFEWKSNGDVAYSPGFVRNEELDKSFSANGGAVAKGVVNDLLWANYNVRSFTDDSLLLSASSPVPDKDPVEFLYNGIRMLALPVNDPNIIQECPCAIITLEPNGIYRATMLSQRLSVFNVDYPDAGDRWLSSKAMGYRYLFDYEGGVWVYKGDGLYASSVSGWDSSALFWTSHDIYYSDSEKVGDFANALYLTATKEMPVCK